MRWGQQTALLRLDARHYDYRKIWLRPWADWFYRRQPPTAIRRALLAGLLKTHADWLRELQTQPEPFYLAVWLFEFPFSHSQVVAATDERIAHYETVFAEQSGKTPTFPAEYAAVPGVADLDWRLYIEVEADYEPPQGRVKGYRQETDANGQLLHIWQGGRVWVGRAREEAKGVG